MLISDVSIKRPVFATVLMLALVTLGIFSYRRLSIDMWPNVEIPVVTVTTILEGAAPETIEREVSRRIEEAVNTIPGVKHVQSISRESISLVVIEFQLEVKIDDVAQDARTKISAIRGDLPQDIEEPIIQKLDVTNMPLVSLALRSSTVDSRDLTSMIDKKIKHRLENLPGVGKVSLVGTTKREIAINLKPDRLTALNMGVDEVIAGVQQENLNIPLGRLKQTGSEYPLRITGKAMNVDEFKTMVIAHRGERPILLGEIADIMDGVEEPKTFAYVDSTPAVAIDIYKQSGANAVEVVDRVKKSVAALQESLPKDVYLEVVRDSSVMIRDSVADVQETIIIGALLTIFIVFLFLNSWRSTVITGLTLPISVISSFIAMNWMGMTLNVMTLMALSLAIGLLIDDAIVVRENIVRHLEKDHDHMKAAREGTSEIGLAVLATTFSIIAVFVPIAYMKGIVGRFFFQFGITVAFAVLVSLLVAFTLDPMLSSRWLDPDILGTGKRRFFTKWLDHFNQGFDRLADQYRRLVGWVLDHRKTMMALALISFIAGIQLFKTIEKNFIPIYDQSEFLLKFKSAPNASLEETKGRVLKALEVLGQYPEVKYTYSTIGAGDWSTVRNAVIFVKLTDKDKRSRGQYELMADIRNTMQQVAGIIVSIEDAGRMDDRKPLLISVRGDDLALLKSYGVQIKQALSGIDRVKDVEMTLEYDIPEYRLTVDRQKATDAGLSSGAIARTISALVAGSVITTYEDKDGDAVDVRVRLPEELRRNPMQINDLRLVVHGLPGKSTLIPLSNVVTYTMSNTPSEINRYDLLREVVVSANLDRLPLGTAMEKAKQITDPMNKTMPPGYRIVYYGESEDMVESFNYMAESLILAIVFVYLILAAQFESFMHPLSIMLSLPLAIVGMVGMLSLTGDTVNIMSLIGLILLMGLVTKNAILLVDYTNVLRSRGFTRREALITAGRTRLRPIVMTTLAMIFGMLPLSLALGAGSEMRAPMARAVIGGLITSTLLTLLVVPVVYSLLEDLQKKFKGRQAIVVILAGFIFLTPKLIYGEEKATRIITLDEAWQIVVQRNKDILKAREGQQKVEGFYLEQRAAAWPQLGISSYLNKDEDESRKAMGGGILDMPVDQKFGSLEAKLTQVIFTWGQVSAAIRGAEDLKAASKEEVKIAEQATLRDVSIAFYNILLAKDLHELALQIIDQKQRHFDESQKKFKAGTATDYDVLAASVAIDNAKPEVIRTENAILVTLEQFKFLLALKDEVIDVNGSLDVTVEEYPQFENVMSITQVQRPEIALLQNQVAAAKENIIISNGYNMPRLDFQSSYGYRDLTFGDTSADGDAWSLGLLFTYPFYDSGRTKGLVMQADSERKSLELDLAKLNDTLFLQARQAVDAVREAGEIVKALSSTVAQAEKLLYMAEKGYQYGSMTRLDVDDAEVNLRQARFSLSRGKRDYLVAQVTLAWVMGIISNDII
jgi:hydrophobic/amphiphilic exporter-1 (mainly G- bacteria), HAE1 family